jgi:predicted nuclease of predicted toxin-antitoxin system
MTFLVDANLPPGLVDWLRSHGYDATHVRDAPGADCDDLTIFEWAKGHNLVVVTKDEDFATMTTMAESSPQVVWLRLGNATNSNLKVWLESRLNNITNALDRAEKLVEVI